MLYDLKITGSVATFYDSKGRGPIIIDTEDLHLLQDRSWTAYQQQTNWYARTMMGPKRLQKCVRLHRLLLQAGPGQIVDHIDGNGLNNCKANLRVCSTTQNGQNRRKGRGPASSVFKGVSKVTRRKLWRATIRVAGTQVLLGCFKLEADAALAYNKAALKYFGEYANLNKV